MAHVRGAEPEEKHRQGKPPADKGSCLSRPLLHLEWHISTGRRRNYVTSGAGA